MIAMLAKNSAIAEKKATTSDTNKSSMRVDQPTDPLMRAHNPN